MELGRLSRIRTAESANNPHLTATLANCADRFDEQSELKKSV